jgi:hypothetical protein
LICNGYSLKIVAEIEPMGLWELGNWVISGARGKTLVYYGAGGA